MVKKSHRKKPIQLRYLLALLIIVLLGWFSWRAMFNKPQEEASTISRTQNTKKPIKQNVEAKAKYIRLIATGDMLPHDTVNQAARTATGYDYLPLFSEVESFLTDSDISYCNQESPSASQYSVTGYPTFNAPPEFAKDLSALGCNVINLANNHANDRGQTGIDATRNVWDKLPTLAVAGTARSSSEQKDVILFSKDGVKFAYLGYAKCSNSTLSNSYGLNMLSTSLVDQQLRAVERDGVDVIIVGIHWCRENTSRQTQEQVWWGRYLAKKGVNVVIGTGPHWLQPVQRFDRAGGGKTVVWYSLGNFLSSQLELNGLIGGIAVMEIDVNSKRITDVGFLPTYMHYEWSRSQAAREDLLARHNLKLYPLDKAAGPLSKSLLDTSVSTQTRRVKKLLNTYTDVTILSSKTYAGFGR